MIYHGPIKITSFTIKGMEATIDTDGRIVKEPVSITIPVQNEEIIHHDISETNGVVEVTPKVPMYIFVSASDSILGLYMLKAELNDRMYKDIGEKFLFVHNPDELGDVLSSPNGKFAKWMFNCYFRQVGVPDIKIFILHPYPVCEEHILSLTSALGEKINKILELLESCTDSTEETRNPYWDCHATEVRLILNTEVAIDSGIITEPIRLTSEK